MAWVRVRKAAALVSLALVSVALVWGWDALEAIACHLALRPAAALAAARHAPGALVPEGLLREFAAQAELEARGVWSEHAGLRILALPEVMGAHARLRCARLLETARLGAAEALGVAPVPLVVRFPAYLHGALGRHTLTHIDVEASRALDLEVLAHEVVHAHYLGALLRPGLPSSSPWWLEEGLADHLASPWLGPRPWEPVDSLDRRIGRLRDYDAARAWVAFLDARGGRTALQALLRRLARGEPGLPALVAAYGEGLPALEAAWRDGPDFRRPPRPASVDSGPWLPCPLPAPPPRLAARTPRSALMASLALVALAAAIAAVRRALRPLGSRVLRHVRSHPAVWAVALLPVAIHGARTVADVGVDYTQGFYLDSDGLGLAGRHALGVALSALAVGVYLRLVRRPWLPAGRPDLHAVAAPAFALSVAAVAGCGPTPLWDGVGWPAAVVPVVLGALWEEVAFRRLPGAGLPAAVASSGLFAVWRAWPVPTALGLAQALALGTACGLLARDPRRPSPWGALGLNAAWTAVPSLSTALAALTWALAARAAAKLRPLTGR
ncbi:MAG: hypothetical protein HY722_14340 [Planctomycetes bacterium]|nr:hypothetical protein [Planctomycetota bacterium]